jgi:hypothetical protein
MPSLLYELENNEAMLLMYLSGELPPEDQAEVEQMLASDGGLRMELEEIRSAMADSMEAVATLDKLQPITPSAQSIALRNVSRSMKQWHVDRLRAAPVVEPHKAWRYPMWVYPTSAVASVLVGVLVWWGLSPQTNTDFARVSAPAAGGDLVTGPGVTPNAGQNIGAVSDTEDKEAMLERSLNGEQTGLADAEAQANSLVARTNNPTATIFPNDLDQ